MRIGSTTTALITITQIGIAILIETIIQGPLIILQIIIGEIAVPVTGAVAHRVAAEAPLEEAAEEAPVDDVEFFLTN